MAVIPTYQKIDMNFTYDRGSFYAIVCEFQTILVSHDMKLMDDEVSCRELCIIIVKSKSTLHHSCINLKLMYIYRSFLLYNTIFVVMLTFNATFASNYSTKRQYVVLLLTVFNLFIIVSSRHIRTHIWMANTYVLILNNKV